MTSERSYPAGVTCWIDTEQPDVDAARHFYANLFGWTFTDAVLADVPGTYLIASLDGADVAAIGPPQGDAPVEWNTYIAVDDATGFYAPIFGWEFDDIGFATMIRRPGYGDHLAATVDPGIFERQDGIFAPPGFADAIGWLVPLVSGRDHWHVTFTVESRDEAAATAERLGAVVISSDDTEWTRAALIRDPQGAQLTLSQFTPPSPWRRRLTVGTGCPS